MNSALAAEPLPDFGSEPIWLVLVKVVAIFGFLVVMTLFAIIFERRVIGRMQNRIGPNRVGPRGALQSLADGIKLAFKEDLVPVVADKWVFFLAPVVSAVPAFLAFAVIPFGPEVSIFGNRTALQLTDLPVAVLYVLACSSLGVYGIVLAGWASGSTYPLLGGLRSAAQMVSYEVAMGLSFVAVFVTAGSLSTSQIVAAQEQTWYALVLAPSLIIYAVSAVGETNRAPFDLPEGESEIVGGFHTEYSSLKFAMFFLAEYINMVTVSAIAVTLFFGGWRAPVLISMWEGANTGWWPVLWFTGKVLACLFVFVWLRGSLPRLRYDQFMRLGWKVLVPASLIWLLLVSAVRTLTREGVLNNTNLYYVAGAALVVLLLIAVFWPDKRKAREIDDEEEREPETVSRFPTPPMDLVVPPSPRLVATEKVDAKAGDEKVGAGARTGDGEG